MEQKTKKLILIAVAAGAGVLLAAALGIYLIFLSQFALYEDKTYGFSIKYPKKWQKAVEPQPGAAVVFASPAENAMDTFLENVNISIEPLPEGISTAKGFSDQVVMQMTKVFKTMKLVGKKPVTFGGRQGYAMVFAVEQPRAIRILNVITVKGAQRAYVFTYMALASRYKTYLPLAGYMIKSFRLK